MEHFPSKRVEKTPLTRKYTNIFRQDNTIKYKVPSIRSFHGFGHVDGMGSVSLDTATPYATAKASIPLYGVSPVSNSHNTTP